MLVGFLKVPPRGCDVPPGLKNYCQGTFLHNQLLKNKHALFMCDSPHEICWEHSLVFLSLLNMINMVSREFLMVRVYSLNISKN